MKCINFVILIFWLFNQKYVIYLNYILLGYVCCIFIMCYKVLEFTIDALDVDKTGFVKKMLPRLFAKSVNECTFKLRFQTMGNRCW